MTKVNRTSLDGSPLDQSRFTGNLSGLRTPEQEMVKREIESTDRAIDKLVYELYGLTEEGIRIVEGVLTATKLVST